MLFSHSVWLVFDAPTSSGMNVRHLCGQSCFSTCRRPHAYYLNNSSLPRTVNRSLCVHAYKTMLASAQQHKCLTCSWHCFASYWEARRARASAKDRKQLIQRFRTPLQPKRQSQCLVTGPRQCAGGPAGSRAGPRLHQDDIELV